MKKLLVVAAAAVIAAGSLSACSKELSNEYVTVKQYKGLEVPQVEPAEVTDEQVEQVIESNLNEAAVDHDITDRAAQAGDWVNIDYTGYIDGTEFDGGSAAGVDLQLGSGSFIGAAGDYAGFEDQIAGHQTGEEFDITVQFPDQYSPEVAGKVADFHIVLNRIYEKSIPDLTDEWVKENSDTAKNEDEYREEVRTQLEADAQDTADSQLKLSLQDELLNQVEVKEYPQDYIDQQTEKMKENYSQAAEMYGVDMDQFITSYLGTTEEEFNAKIEETVQQSAALNEAVKLIAKKEKLELTDEEYDKKIEEYAKEAGAEVDEFKEQVGEDELKTAILADTVLDFLLDNCIQVEESAE